MTVAEAQLTGKISFDLTGDEYQQRSTEIRQQVLQSLPSRYRTEITLGDGGKGPLSEGDGSDGSESSFVGVLEHEDAAIEIAAGNGPDAYLFRIVLALERGDDPDPDDLDRLRQDGDIDERRGV